MPAENGAACARLQHACDVGRFYSLVYHLQYMRIAVALLELETDSILHPYMLLSCRGTAVNEGRLHSSDTWDFTEGDLWCEGTGLMQGLAAAAVQFVGQHQHVLLKQAQPCSCSQRMHSVCYDVPLIMKLAI